MQIRINVIPHADQRYPTVGDWYEERGLHKDEDELVIRVSQTGDERANLLVAVHELIEAVLCQQRGITADQVDEWDITFKGEGEPGNDINAPYYREHQFATQVEQMLAVELGIDWEQYEKLVDSLPV